MKKNKTKNKIFAVAIISALLCAMFCITAFAWDSSWNVLPVLTNDVYAGYGKFVVSNINFSWGGSNVVEHSTSRSVTYVSCYIDSSSQVLYSSNSVITLYHSGSGSSPSNIKRINFGTSAYSFLYDYGSSSRKVANGGVIFVLEDDVDVVKDLFDTYGVTYTYEEPVDPVQEIFDDISIGVSGSMTSVGTVASALTSNTLLTIMCIALPIVSIGVGFFVRLKNKA